MHGRQLVESIGDPLKQTRQTRNFRLAHRTPLGITLFAPTSSGRPRRTTHETRANAGRCTAQRWVGCKQSNEIPIGTHASADALKPYEDESHHQQHVAVIAPSPTLLRDVMQRCSESGARQVTFARVLSNLCDLANLLQHVVHERLP
jgi:hypothetical protein